MANIKQLSESQEDYLEAIFTIASKKGAARVKDVADSMKVASASVNRAVSSLTEHGYINHERYDLISLTDKGREKASQVIDKHTALTQFFREVLCIDEPEASDAACRMEHAISDTTMDRISFLSRFLLDSTKCGHNWTSAFKAFCIDTQDLQGEDACRCTKA